MHDLSCWDLASYFELPVKLLLPSDFKSSIIKDVLLETLAVWGFYGFFGWIAPSFLTSKICIGISSRKVILCFFDPFVIAVPFLSLRISICTLQLFLKKLLKSSSKKFFILARLWTRFDPKFFISSYCLFLWKLLYAWTFSFEASLRSGLAPLNTMECRYWMFSDLGLRSLAERESWTLLFAPLLLMILESNGFLSGETFCEDSVKEEINFLLFYRVSGVLITLSIEPENSS